MIAQPNAYHTHTRWTNALINRLAELNNPRERHITTQNPHTTFNETYQNIIYAKTQFTKNCMTSSIVTKYHQL